MTLYKDKIQHLQTLPYKTRTITSAVDLHIVQTVLSHILSNLKLLWKRCTSLHYLLRYEVVQFGEFGFLFTSDIICQSQSHVAVQEADRMAAALANNPGTLVKVATTTGNVSTRTATANSNQSIKGIAVQKPGSNPGKDPPLIRAFSIFFFLNNTGAEFVAAAVKDERREHIGLRSQTTTRIQSIKKKTTISHWLRR